MRHRSFVASVAMLALCALFVASGGHWVLLQGVAWTRMLTDFSRTESVAGAVAKTFDGKHPCRLCSRVAKESSSERKVPVSVDPAQKFGFFLAPRVAHLFPPAATDRKYPPLLCQEPGDVHLEPPGPVPKSRVS